MTKSLLIVESPTKAKTLNKYLGKDFKVIASVGHIKDLPKKELGVMIENDFVPVYEVIKGKEKTLKELKAAAAKAESIYLAPDPDREGEAIAWHIADEIQKKKQKNGEDKNIYRVLFHELTRPAISKALESPIALDRNKFESQQTRRILDRLVGYQLSPLLWKKVQRGLSAGRVQSVAVRIICEREREILAFVSEEYWTITVFLKVDEEQSFEAKLIKINGKKPKIINNDQCLKHVAIIENHPFIVDNIKTKERKRFPQAPFTTSTLQQDASHKLGFSSKKTMMLAQRLYEGIEIKKNTQVGLITYMRTDSKRISKEAQDAAKDYILKNLGENFVPSKAPHYKNRKNTQDAHEAIRPSQVDITPESLKNRLDKDLFRLYELIWKRFLASQMAPALIDQTVIDIMAGPPKVDTSEYLFRATGNIMKFPGFLSIYEGIDKNNKKNGDTDKVTLPRLNPRQSLELIKVNPLQHFTQPPPRYNEASLVKELEEKGIGRPSTYAAIISNIQDRQYVNKVQAYFKPTDLGFLITDLLVKNFSQILDINFTAQMEDNLDAIEFGELNWVTVLKKFYENFGADLARAQTGIEDIKSKGVSTGLKCPECGLELRIKWGRNGKFLTCSGYPECSVSMDFTRDDRGNIIPEQNNEKNKKVGECPLCSSPLILKKGRYGQFKACSSYPECKYTASEKGDDNRGEIEYSKEICDKCNGKMVVKYARAGNRFLSCEKYPACKNAKPFSTGVKCNKEGCDGEFVERGGKRGSVFYGCSRYPKCRNTSASQPVSKSCPECGFPYLVKKNVGSSEAHLACPNKECDFIQDKKRDT